MSNLINIEKLNKGSGQEFIQQLANVPYNLNEKNIKQFYSTLSNIFQRNEISETSIAKSLIALYKVILDGNENYLKVYQENNFILDLPYDSKYHSVQDRLLDVLYAIATYTPTSFNSEASLSIEENLLKKHPRKTLTIIAIYAKSFDTLNDPWPLLDLLIKNSQSFINNVDCCQDYVSLLVYLCKNEDYCQTRIENCWNCTCQALNTDDEPTLTTIYNSLCILYELDPETISTLTFPIFACSIHLLKKQDVAQSVISLLFRYQPNFDPSNDGAYFSRSRSMSSPKSPKSQTSNMISLIQSLIKVAKNDVNANFILVKMATDENIAKLILHNSNWMIEDLPSKIDTMRLFAVVLSHESLRSEIMEKAETIDFLRNICSLNVAGVLTAICIFIRRLPLDEEYVNYLSDSQFLVQFFSTAFEHNDDTTLHAALVMADTISKICYVRELSQYSEKIAELAKSDSDLAITAGKVAVEMCKYPKCAQRFRRARLDEYYSSKARVPKLKKIASHFLKAFKEISPKLENENQELTRSSPTRKRVNTNDDNASDSTAAALSPPVTPKVNYGNLSSSSKNTRQKRPV